MIVPCVRRNVGKSLRPGATPSVSRLRREPAPSRGSLGRTAGVAREDKIFRPQKIFLLHESYGTRLPREGAAEG